MTITEAAEVTGLSRKAMARRVERGSVRSVLRSGRRLIPRSELIRIGLLPPGGVIGEGLLAEQGADQDLLVSSLAGDEQNLVSAVIRELLQVVQRQAGDLAQYRAITAEAESLRLEREVAELRVRLAALEVGEGRPALERGSSIGQAPPPQIPPQQSPLPPPASAATNLLWVPVSAKGVPDSTATLRVPPPIAGGPRSPRMRLLSLALEMLFIALVAFLVWLADVGPMFSAGAVGVAWAVVAAVEVSRWRSRHTL